MHFYLIVSVGTKLWLVHVVQALTQEYCFSVTKSLQVDPWLALAQRLQVARSYLTFPLSSFSTNGYIPAHSRRRHFTQNRKVEDLLGATEAQKLQHTSCMLESLTIQLKRSNTPPVCLNHSRSSSRPILTLMTLTKHVLRFWWITLVLWWLSDMLLNYNGH
jgi:hypothetical protein